MTDTTWTPATYRIAMSSTYRIAMSRTDRDVTGSRLGVFGVGPSVEPAGTDWWTVTHLPTGLRIGDDFGSETQARRFAEGLALLRDDWPQVTRAATFTAAFITDVAALDRVVRAGGLAAPTAVEA